MARYDSSKPTKTFTQWLKTIGTRLIFPPILLADAALWGINRWLGKKVGELVLPAQTEDVLPCPSNLSTAFRDIEFIKHLVVTHDQCYLDTIEIEHASQKIKPVWEQNYLINFLGNAGLYEEDFNLNEMQNDANQLQCNVVGFNYRGVGESKTTGKFAQSIEDLVVDGIAQVNRLLEKGVPASRITLKGHSLGGAIAVLVTKYFHDHGQKISVFCDRSFRDLTHVVVGWIRKSESKLLGSLSYPFIKLALLATKWEINVAGAFKAIPEAYKQYVVIKPSHEEKVEAKRRDRELRDEIISGYASLHRALKNERKKEKQALRTIDAKLIEAYHNNLISKEIIKSREYLAEALISLKDRKMILNPENEYEASHNVELKSLVSRHKKINGQLFFNNFMHYVQPSLSNAAQSSLDRARPTLV